MKHFARTLCLRDDPAKIASYRAYHQRVWPDVLAGLRSVGIREMRIFLRGTRLFMYVEADDAFVPERDWPRSGEHPRAREWDAGMRALQLPAPDAGPGDWWTDMEEVFDLNWPQHLPG
jgi:L-rhamnose mutarotase